MASKTSNNPWRTVEDHGSSFRVPLERDKEKEYLKHQTPLSAKDFVGFLQTPGHSKTISRKRSALLSLNNSSYESTATKSSKAALEKVIARPPSPSIPLDSSSSKRSFSPWNLGVAVSRPLSTFMSDADSESEQMVDHSQSPNSPLSSGSDGSPSPIALDAETEWDQMPEVASKRPPSPYDEPKSEDFRDSTSPPPSSSKKDALATARRDALRFQSIYFGI